MIIDVFCHHIGRTAAELLDKKPYYGKGKEFDYPQENADPEVRLGLMEKYGVDMQALTQTTPVMLGCNAEEALEICRASNNDNYSLCKAYPGKFVNICMASMMDIRNDIKEVERSVNDLDARGVTISTSINGKGLDAPEFDPFWEAVQKYDLPVFLHPVSWKDYPLAERYRMMNLFGWPFDTTVAVWTIIFGGVLDRFPGLKFVTHHMGAMLPFFHGRAEDRFKRFLAPTVKKTLNEYWRSIYGDTAVDGGVNAYPCGYAFFGPDRLMFGTDYPFGYGRGDSFIKDNLNCVKNMNIPDADKKKILGENARKLLKLK